MGAGRPVTRERGRLCVLVDEPELRSLGRDVLDDEGAEEHPDLFVIDSMLPQMDGIALAGRTLKRLIESGRARGHSHVI